jgi:stage V sporulation protein G
VNITEVKVKRTEDRRNERLRAFCTITINGEFVVRDLKIIEGAKGIFVAMPSRKLVDRCPSCGGKNHLRAKYCNDCGARLADNRAERDEQGRAKLHADIAHPINSRCREELQGVVLAAYKEDLERSRESSYQPPEYQSEKPQSPKTEEKEEEDNTFGQGIFS